MQAGQIVGLFSNTLILVPEDPLVYIPLRWAVLRQSNLYFYSLLYFKSLLYLCIVGVRILNHNNSVGDEPGDFGDFRKGLLLNGCAVSACQRGAEEE